MIFSLHFIFGHRFIGNGLPKISILKQNSPIFDDFLKFNLSAFNCISRWKQFHNNYWFAEMESRLYKGVTSWHLLFCFSCAWVVASFPFQWMAFWRVNLKLCIKNDEKIKLDPIRFDFNAIEFFKCHSRPFASEWVNAKWKPQFVWSLFERKIY